MAYNQHGHPLIAFVQQGNHGGSEKPVWPPLGYNIILRAPKSVDLHSVWPKLGAGGVVQAPFGGPTSVEVRATLLIILNIQMPRSPHAG